MFIVPVASDTVCGHPRLPNTLELQFWLPLPIKGECRASVFPHQAMKALFFLSTLGGQDVNLKSQCSCSLYQASYFSLLCLEKREGLVLKTPMTNLPPALLQGRLLSSWGSCASKTGYFQDGV